MKLLLLALGRPGIELFDKTENEINSSVNINGLPLYRTPNGTSGRLWKA